jgi:hypothetical protein
MQDAVPGALGEHPVGTAHTVGAARKVTKPYSASVTTGALRRRHPGSAGEGYRSRPMAAMLLHRSAGL